MSSTGIPMKLLNESMGHIVTVELNTGQTLRGKLLEMEETGNCSIQGVTSTARDGRVSHLEQVYVRGSNVRLYIVPDMLRNAPMFKTRPRAAPPSRGRARGRPQ